MLLLTQPRIPATLSTVVGLLSLALQPCLHIAAPKLLLVSPAVSHLLTVTGAVVAAWNVLVLSPAWKL